MIVVDTSAVLAILWDEPEGDAFGDLMLDAGTPLIAAPTRLEIHVVCRRRFGPRMTVRADELLTAANIEVVTFDETLLSRAREAYDRYGTGRYGLNFGDCFSYALAKARDLPLLFKGEDFAATDVIRAA